jgi:hypothetical protein
MAGDGEDAAPRSASLSEGMAHAMSARSLSTRDAQHPPPPDTVLLVASMPPPNVDDEGAVRDDPTKHDAWLTPLALALAHTFGDHLGLQTVPLARFSSDNAAGLHLAVRCRFLLRMSAAVALRTGSLTVDVPSGAETSFTILPHEWFDRHGGVDRAAHVLPSSRSGMGRAIRLSADAPSFIPGFWEGSSSLDSAFAWPTSRGTSSMSVSTGTSTPPEKEALSSMPGPQPEPVEAFQLGD